ncbi:hypothetical protein GCM10027615_44510 [Plantactinospora veratri]
MKHRSPRGILAVVATATIAASALVGCSSGGSSATDHGAGEGPVPEPTAPVTISFASWVGEQPEMKKLVQQFQTEHPNIKIELQNVPAEEANEKLTAQIAGGTRRTWPSSTPAPRPTSPPARRWSTSTTTCGAARS